ncbi:NAD(P)/FAD-dependent oxidoreductase [Murimonas intestini]|uniref:NAD(P)/FAD-dependent oxidoreductase n=1 Tax=Murimonas intestini TaxID=1337051 RepID=A0AB73T9I8_9FIRM|nr:NAD(P)/FAD-dependent oxidoreductase [Murimonas intestini]MCR1839363.1 NAD(P)/FAD-dependent oxidoreductase [Murimonas intestini]MCR1864658.1 NAD(P)/FAD-dependent oxidoreductase [Murimonas intestini]MCR1882268.1 NAD(P)/FAD-dependent oxidoreductase [Murimonas intestini]
MSRVVIAGGGAAGMMASISAARSGHEVHVYEKNEKLGKKLFITGKGRCNLTNACDMETLFENVCSNRKFLYSAFYGFSNQDTVAFFEDCGLKVKLERGDRVFPASDHSSDVIGVLSRKMKELGVNVHLNCGVKELVIEEGKVKGILTEGNALIPADEVIIATGGISYPSTGSTGDGYRFARAAGHTVSELSPALVPLNIKEDFAKQLQGLSLRNVRAGVFKGKKCLYEDFGEMMFTHFGVTGPLILSASSLIQKELKKGPLTLSIDLKPALSQEQLDARILRDFKESKNKQFKNSLGGLFPSKLIPVMVELSGIMPEKQVNEISREERTGFLHKIKHLELTITGLRDYNEAIITKGGVVVKEINPATMESKLVKGLYFIGEVLDLDALTGGFNLQIAWSTAVAAGGNI